MPYRPCCARCHRHLPDLPAGVGLYETDQDDDGEVIYLCSECDHADDDDFGEPWDLPAPSAG